MLFVFFIFDLGIFSAERVMASPKIDIAVKKYFIIASVT